jgi:hypothetical protein
MNRQRGDRRAPALRLVVSNTPETGDVERDERAEAREQREMRRAVVAKIVEENRRPPDTLAPRPAIECRASRG